MASDSKSLLAVALLICVVIAEEFDPQMRQALDRFCGYTYEQKTAAVTCAMNNYPAVIRDIFVECIPPEDNGSWDALIESISYSCNPEQYGTERRRQFAACMAPKEREAISENRVTGDELIVARNVFIICFNEAGAEKS